MKSRVFKNLLYGPIKKKLCLKSLSSCVACWSSVMKKLVSKRRNQILSKYLPCATLICNETQIDLKEPSADSECNGQAHDDDQDAVYGDIINKREKIKETDEYKRAMKEEWAARQLQIQFQGKEAQRLRKRKTIETVRILDMERRQKQRVLEVRETRKKDEEYMNLKEQLRVETREELHKLEETCTDMASLLGGLGIIVGGGLEPTSNEVNVAYKRALLRFHPDRASRTDIHQQVEA